MQKKEEKTDYQSNRESKQKKIGKKKSISSTFDIGSSIKLSLMVNSHRLPVFIVIFDFTINPLNRYRTQYTEHNTQYLNERLHKQTTQNQKNPAGVKKKQQQSIIHLMCPAINRKCLTAGGY